MVVVQAMQNDAHALVRGNKSAYSQDPSNQREDSVASASITKRYEYSGGEACEDETDAKGASKPDTREVAITDRPANKVGM